MTPNTVTTRPVESVPMAMRPGGSRRLIGIVVGLTLGVCLMLLAFALPAINSGPRDLPLAVSGPATAVDQLTATVDGANPGAFAITTYASGEEVRSAIESRDAVGGIVLGQDGVTVLTASAAGTPYASIIGAIGSGLSATGQQVTFEDVAPLAEGDPTGAGINALALPLAFGGMASAIALVVLIRRSRTLQAVGALAFSVVAGLSVAAILQFALGSIDGQYWQVSAAIALGVAAVSFTMLGLGSLMGYPGLALGAVFILFFANPLSGIATGAAWLPQPWGAIGQFLPLGAGGTLIRSTAFFDGAGIGQAMLVLCGWVVLGLGLLVLAAWRDSRRGDARVVARR